METQQIINREAELQSEAFDLLHKINARSYCESPKDAISRLMLIRCIAYESLSQIQHEWAVLKSLTILKETYPEIADWIIHPRQTGGNSDPDIRGDLGFETVVSAEVTSSLNTKGAMGKRMRVTLAKLESLPGKKHYFVINERIAKVARLLVKSMEYSIEVHSLDLYECDQQS